MCMQTFIFLLLDHRNSSQEVVTCNNTVGRKYSVEYSCLVFFSDSIIYISSFTVYKNREVKVFCCWQGFFLNTLAVKIL